MLRFYGGSAGRGGGPGRPPDTLRPPGAPRSAPVLGRVPARVPHASRPGVPRGPDSRLEVPGHRPVHLHECQQDDEIGHAESEAEQGASPAGGAPAQRETPEHHREGPEEQVESEQADESEDARGDGRLTGVTEAPFLTPVAVTGGCACRRGRRRRGARRPVRSGA